MTMRRSKINEILKIAKQNKGIVYWEDDYRPSRMKFRYRFVFQKTQFKCFYEFMLYEKWCESKIHILTIPYGRKHGRYVNSSYKDTLITTQLHAHLTGLMQRQKKHLEP